MGIPSASPALKVSASSGPRTRSTAGVSIEPGEIEFTRMPRPVSSFAQAWASDRTAAFEAV
jgi:hypothetical protein